MGSYNAEHLELFSNAATVRDNFMDSVAQRRWSTLALLPQWGWKGWLLGVLTIGIIAALEGSYREHVKLGNRLLVAEESVGVVQRQLVEARSIRNAPEIRLDLLKVPGGFDLVVSNRSMDKNADAILVGRIETSKLRLDTDRIDFLAAGADVIPKVRMFEKADGSQYMDPDYSKLFADVCEEIGFEAEVVVAVNYRGLGHEFSRNVTIATHLVELEAAASGMSGSPFRIEHGEIQACS